MIEPRSVYALWRREMTRLKRSPERLIGGSMMPLLFMVFLGTGFDTMQMGSLPEGVAYMQYLVPGIIGMTMLFSGSFAGMSLLWDREHGFLREVMVTPSSRLSIVLGRIVGGGTLSVVQGLIILVAAYLIGFRAQSLAGVGVSIGFLVLIAVTFIGLGMIFASTMHDSQGFGMVMNMVIFPLFFLSGALFPIGNLPSVLQYVALINPLTYGIDGMRAGLIGVADRAIFIDGVAMIVSAVILLALGTVAFQRMEMS